MAGTVSATVREDGKEAWLKPLGRMFLVIFVCLPLLGYLAPRWAGRLTWTVLIAGLPLFIVLAGYHRWRQLCPLAWFAQIAGRIGRPGERRASRWLQANYYYLTFAVLATCLWLRLVATNGHGGALATFLIVLSLAAIAYGATYTGKTWCNYVCPVAMVEKIYTEPRGLQPTSNSQCPKCTACKPACPDINEENGYWKEITSTPKRFAYFAFPGLVFSFYLYFYLQSGTWNYYFGGRWTNEPTLLRTAFLRGHDAVTAGFFFAPSWPRAVAALITLATGVLVSFAVFSAIERWVGQRRQRRDPETFDAAALRHTLLTAASFVAFVTFYSFAGAPTIRLVPGVSYFVQILVVATATLALARRFSRRQGDYAEETLARQIIRRWEWADMKPPEDLHEVFLIHKIRSQTDASGYARLLETYKESVREAVAAGLLSHAEIQRLESLRNQLRISPADHERVMADLDEEERAFLDDPGLHALAEKRLQLDAYEQALRDYLAGISASSALPDDSVVRHLRQQYAVTAEEHTSVLTHLLAGAGGDDSYLTQTVALIEHSMRTIELIEAVRSHAGDFLAGLLRERCRRAVEGLMRGFGCAADDPQSATIRDGLLATDLAQRESAMEALGATVAPVVAARLKTRHRSAFDEARTLRLEELLRAGLTSSAAYLRAASLYVLHERAGTDEATLTSMIRDDHDLVRETALRLLFLDRQIEPEAEKGLVTLERMIALRAVPLFTSLPPEDLACLARAALERHFGANDVLCLEGDPGDEVFVLLSGDVVILRKIGEEDKIVHREQAGGFVGEMAVIDPAPRAATVMAGSNGCSALCLNGPDFRSIVEQNPSVARGVMRALSARIRGAQTPQRPAAPAPTSQAAGR